VVIVPATPPRWARLGQNKLLGQRSWQSITSSDDGTKLAAVDSRGYIYTSTDSGATWTEQTSSGQRSWYSITSSSDGTKLAAGNVNGYIYTSTDSGVTWTEQTSSGQGAWRSITSAMASWHGGHLIKMKRSVIWPRSKVSEQVHKA
jgi:photosystem II stability/assembly factor-like uncharacterized protein